MTDANSPLVRHEHLLPDEKWTDSRRGDATWRTFFSRDVTPTTALTTGISAIPAGAELVRHHHEAVETYYFLEGTGLLTLGGAEYEVRSGSAVHIPSLTDHGVRNTGAHAVRFFYAFAADSFLDVEYNFGWDAE